MSQYRRLGKNLETPRPLNSSGMAAPAKNQYEIHGIDELITLIENVATTLANGSSNSENLNMLTYNLRIHGPRLEEIAKDTLDRTFVVLRNSSQDERLSIMTRLNLLELIELRAKHWQVSNDINSYYHQSKASNKVEPDGLQVQMEPMLLSTSPPLQLGSVMSSGPAPALGPGELIRNSGKFTKPTKIPGKNYSKDEIVIRNADSGKVMGIKGRRVHMIEELSETIISFQKVNPGAKERLVQITGPSEEKINYAKSLIEDTIRRNASPVRLDAQEDASSGGMTPGNGVMMGNIMQQPVHQSINVTQSPLYMPNQGVVASKFRNFGSAGGGPQHSYSTDDASLGEYKYTVNVGQHSIKITGDNFELIRTAKLVLDDYFSSAEFLQNVGDPEELHQYHGVAMTQDTSAFNNGQNVAVVRDDSGIALDKKIPGKNLIQELDETNYDDEVFIVDENGQEIPVGESGAALTRSKKSNNLQYSNSPSETNDSSVVKKQGSNGTRICYNITELLEFSNNDFAWSLPHNWIKICEKWPALVRNKDLANEKNRFNVQKYLECRSQVIEEKSLEPSNSSSSILDGSTDADNDSVEKLPISTNVVHDDDEERNL